MVDSLCEDSLADPQTPDLVIGVLKARRKRWCYRRQVARWMDTVAFLGGPFPAEPMAEARE